MFQTCSEAILLGGLAMKRNWQNRRKNEGKPTNKPNIVMGSEIHVRRHLHAPANADPARCRVNAVWHLLGRLKTSHHLLQLLQVCWEKLTNYFEIEARYVNLTEDCYVAKVQLPIWPASHVFIEALPSSHPALGTSLTVLQQRESVRYPCNSTDRWKQLA